MEQETKAQKQAREKAEKLEKAKREREAGANITPEEKKR